TMPPLNAEQVSSNTKLDIVAYLLQVNGFPAGSTELALDAAALDTLEIVPTGAESSGAPNFALVQMLGCLSEGPNGRWMLTNSTTPTVTKDESATPEALKAAEARPLGAETFELVSVSPSFKAETHKGHKVEARGLLYKDSSYAEVNLTSLEMIAPSCGR